MVLTLVLSSFQNIGKLVTKTQLYGVFVFQRDLKGKQNFVNEMVFSLALFQKPFLLPSPTTFPHTPYSSGNLPSSRALFPPPPPTCARARISLIISLFWFYFTFFHEVIVCFVLLHPKKTTTKAMFPNSVNIKHKLTMLQNTTLICLFRSILSALYSNTTASVSWSREKSNNPEILFLGCLQVRRYTCI